MLSHHVKMIRRPPGQHICVTLAAPVARQSHACAKQRGYNTVFIFFLIRRALRPTELPILLFVIGNTVAIYNSRKHIPVSMNPPPKMYTPKKVHPPQKNYTPVGLVNGCLAKSVIPYGMGLRPSGSSNCNLHLPPPSFPRGGVIAVRTPLPCPCLVQFSIQQPQWALFAFLGSAFHSNTHPSCANNGGVPKSCRNNTSRCLDKGVVSGCPQKTQAVTGKSASLTLGHSSLRSRSALSCVATLPSQ